MLDFSGVFSLPNVENSDLTEEISLNTATKPQQNKAIIPIFFQTFSKHDESSQRLVS